MGPGQVAFEDRRNIPVPLSLCIDLKELLAPRLCLPPRRLSKDALGDRGSRPGDPRSRFTNQPLVNPLLDCCAGSPWYGWNTTYPQSGRLLPPRKKDAIAVIALSRAHGGLLVHAC